jgi:tRNA threonylcarbamoyladenosine biosynthesis protein TsaB
MNPASEQGGGRVLALESSSSRVSVAVWEGNEVWRGAEEGRGSKILPLLVQRAVEAAGKPERILVGVGPGSFSGVRVAVALAQGLARGWGGVEIEARRSTSAVGWKLRDVSFLGIFCDARRGKLCFTAYAQGKLSREPQLIERSELAEYLSKCSLAVSTDGLEGVPRVEWPDAADLAAARDACGPEEGLALEPVYLHPPLAGVAG